MILEGRMFLGENPLNGFYGFDGTNIYKIWNPILIHKILKHKNKIIVSVYGKWWIWCDVILWYKIDKKVVWCNGLSKRERFNDIC